MIKENGSRDALWSIDWIGPDDGAARVRKLLSSPDSVDMIFICDYGLQLFQILYGFELYCTSL